MDFSQFKSGSSFSQGLLQLAVWGGRGFSSHSIQRIPLEVLDPCKGMDSGWVTSKFNPDEIPAPGGKLGGERRRAGGIKESWCYWQKILVRTSTLFLLLLASSVLSCIIDVDNDPPTTRFPPSPPSSSFPLEVASFTRLHRTQTKIIRGCVRRPWKRRSTRRTRSSAVQFRGSMKVGSGAPQKRRRWRKACAIAGCMCLQEFMRLMRWVSSSASTSSHRAHQYSLRSSISSTSCSCHLNSRVHAYLLHRFRAPSARPIKHSVPSSTFSFHLPSSPSFLLSALRMGGLSLRPIHLCRTSPLFNGAPPFKKSSSSVTRIDPLPRRTLFSPTICNFAVQAVRLSRVSRRFGFRTIARSVYGQRNKRGIGGDISRSGIHIHTNLPTLAARPANGGDDLQAR